MIIGYILNGSDNDSFMFEDNDPEYSLFCSNCGFLLNYDYHNPLFKLKRKVFNFSHPYDIGNIVSLRFKEFCIRENYSGLVFKEFEREPNFFQLIVKNIVEFDNYRSQAQLKNYCNKCGNYEEAIVTYTFLTDINYELKDGFYKTNMVFGAKNSKNPLIIVGPETYRKLKREKLRGLYFEAIND